MPSQKSLTINSSEGNSTSGRRVRIVSKWAGFWSALAIGYWLSLVIATHLPAPELVIGGVMQFDKLLHTGAYFVLATVLFITARRLGSSNRLRTGLIIVFGVLLYAAIDEITQPYFNRTCDLSDWIADAVGVMLAFTVDRIRKHGKPSAELATSANQ